MTPEHASGLSMEEARRRLAADGPNELPASSPKRLLGLVRDIVLEPMFLLLLACGGIYLWLGDLPEALMLLAFVLVVMGISFFQQRRAERSLAALRDISSPRALVVRDGSARRIAGRDVVCGDLILLLEGDRVPADLRLLDTSGLALDESMLTGESAPVAKHAARDAGDAGAGGDEDKAYAGTLVTQGSGRGVVVATGARSALGRIGLSLDRLADQDTPVQQETRRLVKTVAAVGLALAALLSVAYGLTRQDWLHGLLAGITLAMAVVPEELPVVLTLFLGLGAWRLARARVLTRNMPALELLGATTVLCVDKTGTLTVNRMRLRRLWSGGVEHDLDRAGAAPLPEALHGVLEYAVLASHRQAFDPMEAAIADAGQRLLASTEHLHGDWTLVSDYPLSRQMLAMSRVWQSPNQRDRVIAAKGAPEAIAELCHLDTRQHAVLGAAVDRMAADGLRVLGVARAGFPARPLPGNQHDFEFRFIGLVGMEDPVRPGVAQAMAECRAAGIRVVMITGDHPNTALSIARQAGLPVGGAALSGADIERCGEEQLQALIAGANVFCRVQPEHKLRLVQAFRAAGDIVAMTGDGINDAPALKAAHIGIAMGGRGSDVAREAADLVLLDDDFASLVAAVRYGRRISANLRKAMVFLLAAHIPIIGLSIAPVPAGWPLLLMPVHILFLQLIIDPSCSLVFEAEPLDADGMRRPPRRPDAPLFDAGLLLRGLWQGCGLLLILLGVFALARRLSGSDAAARALMFAVLVLSSLALIQVNRHWGATAAGGSRHFAWLALATLLLLSMVLAIPAVRGLFAFALPGPGLLLLGTAAALCSLLWFDLGRRCLRR